MSLTWPTVRPPHGAPNSGISHSGNPRPETASTPGALRAMKSLHKGSSGRAGVSGAPARGRPDVPLSYLRSRPEWGGKSGRGERGSQVFGAGFNRLLDRDGQTAVAVQQPAGVDDGQADDALGARLEAQDMALRSLLSFGVLGGTNVEVQHVAFGLVVGVVEDQRSDLDIHGFHRFGSLRVATAVMIPPGCCSKLTTTSSQRLGPARGRCSGAASPPKSAPAHHGTAVGVG